jgi:hypothetical protein
MVNNKELEHTKQLLINNNFKEALDVVSKYLEEGNHTTHIPYFQHELHELSINV